MRTKLYASNIKKWYTPIMDDSIGKLRILKRFLENKKTKELINCIEELSGKAEVIGFGGNAEILSMPRGPFGGICLKRLKELTAFQENDLDKEFEIQVLANSGEVVTPFSMLLVEDIETKKKFIIMERVRGFSIEDVLQRRKTLPSNFNMDDFFKKLKKQIDKLHSVGVYHRDLRSGNVMINEYLDPVIIDFGASVVSTSGEAGMSVYEDVVSIYNEKKGQYQIAHGYFKDDYEAIQDLRSQIKPFVIGYTRTDMFGQPY